jgi:hypothetical protein
MDDFKQVAKLIAGDNAPIWLAEQLRRWGPSLYLDRHVAIGQPSRVKMRLTFKRVIAASRIVNEALASDLVLEFLDAPADPVSENIASLTRDLDWLTGRAEQARNALTKRGRGRAAPPGAISPETYCAVIISEAWGHFHGVKPRPKSEKAQQAAERLWRAAGGEGQFAGEEPLAKWRYHFKLADKPDLKAPRAEYRRHLAESERFSMELAAHAQQAA